MLRPMKTLVVAALLVSAAAAATHGAEETQNASPMPSQTMDGQGGMMGMMEMMGQMNEMMATCTKMMQVMMDGSAPGMHEDPEMEMPATPEDDG